MSWHRLTRAWAVTATFDSLDVYVAFFLAHSMRRKENVDMTGLQYRVTALPGDRPGRDGEREDAVLPV